MVRVLTAAVCALAVLAGCGSHGAPSSAPSFGPSSRAPGPFPTERILEVLGRGATPLVRTDYEDDAAWQRIVATVTAPDATDKHPDPEYGPYEPNIGTVEAAGLDGWSTARLSAAWKGPGMSGYVLIADARSMREERAGGVVTVVYADLNATTADDEALGYHFGRTFRCQLEQVASIEINLAISNMDFFEFADVADQHRGVFTGFGGSIDE